MGNASSSDPVGSSPLACILADMSHHDVYLYIISCYPSCIMYHASCITCSFRSLGYSPMADAFLAGRSR